MSTVFIESPHGRSISEPEVRGTAAWSIHKKTFCRGVGNFSVCPCGARPGGMWNGRDPFRCNPLAKHIAAVAQTNPKQQWTCCPNAQRKVQCFEGERSKCKYSVRSFHGTSLLFVVLMNISLNIFLRTAYGNYNCHFRVSLRIEIPHLPRRIYRWPSKDGYVLQLQTTTTYTHSRVHLV